MASDQSQAPRHVMISKNDDWHVTAREVGRVTERREFVTEEFARSYAEGQRVRLGLDIHGDSAIGGRPASVE